MIEQNQTASYSVIIADVSKSVNHWQTFTNLIPQMGRIMTPIWETGTFIQKRPHINQNDSLGAYLNLPDPFRKSQSN